MKYLGQIASVVVFASWALVACGPIADPASNAPGRRYTIALGSQLVDTRAVDDSLASTRDDGYALVKFAGPVTAEQLQALAATAHIYTYLPHDTFLVRPFSGAASQLDARGAIGAAWTGAYKAEYKISRNAAELAMVAPDDTHTVMV